MANQEINPNQKLIKIWDIPTYPLPFTIQFEFYSSVPDHWGNICYVTKHPSFPKATLFGEVFILSWGFSSSPGLKWVRFKNPLNISSYQEGVNEVERFIKEIGFGYILVEDKEVSKESFNFDIVKEATFILHLDPKLEFIARAIRRKDTQEIAFILYIKCGSDSRLPIKPDTLPPLGHEYLRPHWGFTDAWHSIESFRSRRCYVEGEWNGFLTHIKDYLVTVFPDIPFTETISGEEKTKILIPEADKDPKSVITSNRTTKYLVQLEIPTEFLIVENASKDNKPVVYISVDGLNSIKDSYIHYSLANEPFKENWGFSSLPYSDYRGRTYNGSFIDCVLHVENFLNEIKVPWKRIESFEETFDEKIKRFDSIYGKEPTNNTINDEDIQRIDDKRIDYSSLLARRTFTEEETLPRLMTFEERVIYLLKELNEKVDRLERKLDD